MQWNGIRLGMAGFALAKRPIIIDVIHQSAYRKQCIVVFLMKRSHSLERAVNNRTYVSPRILTMLLSPYHSRTST